MIVEWTLWFICGAVSGAILWYKGSLEYLSFPNKILFISIWSSLGVLALVVVLCEYGIKRKP
jgi:hypothetical protein